MNGQRQDQGRRPPIERLRKPGEPSPPPADGPGSDAIQGIEELLAEIDEALGESEGD